MGVLAETVRGWPGAMRSSHPHVSFAALGPAAEQVVAGHTLGDMLGEGSPLARLYDLDADVLLLGVDHSVSTSLHLAEYRCPGSPREQVGAAARTGDGGREWVWWRDKYGSTRTTSTRWAGTWRPPGRFSHRTGRRRDRQVDAPAGGCRLRGALADPQPDDGGRMTVSAEDYLAVVTETIGRVAAGQREAVAQAADLIADAVGRRGDPGVRLRALRGPRDGDRRAGRRAGADEPDRAARHRPLGGEPSGACGPQLERTRRRAPALRPGPRQPDDTFVIASNSGVNGAVVEMARSSSNGGTP